MILAPTETRQLVEFLLSRFYGERCVFLKLTSFLKFCNLYYYAVVLLCSSTKRRLNCSDFFSFRLLLTIIPSFYQFSKLYVYNFRILQAKVTHSTTNIVLVPNYTAIKLNLMEYSDRFSAVLQAAEIEKSRLSAMNPSFANTNNSSESTDSFLSLLIPAPLRETLWTTVALYLGWRLVSRLR